MIESEVEKRLYFGSACEQNVHRSLDVVAKLDRQLESWKANVPSIFQPDHIIWASTTTARLPIILLHLAYYRTVGEIHGFAAHLREEGDIRSMSIVRDLIQASAASQIIHTLQYLPSQQPGQVLYLCSSLQVVTLLIAP